MQAAYIASVGRAIAAPAPDVVVARLTDRSVVERFVTMHRVYELVSNLRRAHRLLAEQASPLLRPFLAGVVELLVQNECSEPLLAFRLEAIVSWMDAHPDRDFLFDLLEQGIRHESDAVASGTLEGFRSKCGGYFAGLSRRDAQHLRRANDALPEIIEFWRPRNLATLATFEYEMAFVHFLHGHLDEAIELFASSEAHAMEGRDPLGATISRCLVARVQLRRDRGTGEDCVEAMEQAHVDFGRIGASAPQNSREHRLSFRWRMSVKIHAFEGAFAGGDVDTAERMCRELQQDEFIRNAVSMDDPGRSALVHRVEARLHMLKQEWPNATCKFAQYLPIAHDDVPSRDHPAVSWRRASDELAWEYLDFGIALDALGLPQIAEEAWKTGLACEPLFGNGIWQSKIEDRLGRTSDGAIS